MTCVAVQEARVLESEDNHPGIVRFHGACLRQIIVLEDMEVQTCEYRGWLLAP